MKITELLEAKAQKKEYAEFTDASGKVNEADTGGIWQMEVPFAATGADDDPDLEAAKFARKYKVNHKMTNPNGPSGGWPEFLFWGPRANMEKFAKAYSDGNQEDEEALEGLVKSRQKYDPSVFDKPLGSHAEELAQAIASVVKVNGTRVFDVFVDVEMIYFAVEFDFPEGFIKGSEIKKASKMIQSVTATKSQDWRQGEFGADYSIELKEPLNRQTEKKFETAFKKAVK